MIVVRTVEGNHMRQHREGGRSNQREVDVIAQEMIPEHCRGFAATDIGVTTPYRLQASKTSDILDQLEADTVHKFQGRQKWLEYLRRRKLRGRNHRYLVGHAHERSGRHDRDAQSQPIRKLHVLHDRVLRNDTASGSHNRPVLGVRLRGAGPDVQRHSDPDVPGQQRCPGVRSARHR